MAAVEIDTNGFADKVVQHSDAATLRPQKAVADSLCLTYVARKEASHSMARNC